MVKRICAGYRRSKTNQDYAGDKYGKQDEPKYSYKRHRDRRWMTYTSAKLTTQEKSKAKTRAQYFRWHDYYKPVAVPKQPQNVYKEEWEGWNIFLDSDNTWDGYDRKFGQTYDWRDFWESVKYVQGLGLQSKNEYLKLHREGGIPKDIPMAPDRLPIWKDKWIGWPGFLGKELSAKLEVIKNVTKLLCICQDVNNVSNILSIIVCKGGLKEYEERVKSNKDLVILKRYVIEEGDIEILDIILGRIGSDQGSGMYMFSNVNEFLYECDGRLMMYRE